MNAGRGGAWGGGAGGGRRAAPGGENHRGGGSGGANGLEPTSELIALERAHAHPPRAEAEFRGGPNRTQRRQMSHLEREPLSGMNRGVVMVQGTNQVLFIS